MCELLLILLLLFVFEVLFDKLEMFRWAVCPSIIIVLLRDDEDVAERFWLDTARLGGDAEAADALVVDDEEGFVVVFGGVLFPGTD